MTIVTGHMGNTISRTHNTSLSNFTFDPHNAWLGAPDGTAAWSNSYGSPGGPILVGNQFGFNIPAGAVINSVKFVFAAPRSSTAAVVDFYGADGTTIVETFSVARNVTKTLSRTYTAEELNALKVRWAQSFQSDYSTLDAMTVTVDYTAGPTGPVVSYFANGVWNTSTSVQKFDGTNWVNATVTKY